MAGPPKAKIREAGGNDADLLTVASLKPFTPYLQQASHCYVAFSGGVDSHVLLHLLAQILPKHRLTAVHINHQLSVNADQWSDHCQAVCDEMQVTCKISKVEVDPRGSGLEAAARDARYGVFGQVLQENDLLVLAHHGDDQVETLLYRLLRGSGVSGLSGMPCTRSLGKGTLLRPLLGFSRSAIERFAREHNLHWIEDESNNSLQFDRNFLRNQIIPKLAERWPNYLSRFAITARLLREAEQLNEVLAKQDFSLMQETRQRLGFSVSIEMLTQLEKVRQNNLLRFWFRKHQLPVPGHKIIDAITDNLLTARIDAQPVIECPGAELRRYQSKLYLLPKASVATDVSPELAPTTPALLLSPNVSLPLPDGSKLTSQSCIGDGLRYSANDLVEVRFRKGGERCRPVGRGGSNSLKNLFQEYHLEPWLRDKVPLVYLNGQLAAVADLWVCESFQAKPGEAALRLTWHY